MRLALQGCGASAPALVRGAYWISDSCASRMRQPSGRFFQMDVAATRMVDFIRAGSLLVSPRDCRVAATSGLITVIPVGVCRRYTTSDLPPTHHSHCWFRTRFEGIAAHAFL